MDQEVFAAQLQRIGQLELANDELFTIKQKVVIANHELTRKLAEAEADFAWMEKNPDKFLCLGGKWEYLVGGKGTRHDPWHWSNMRSTSLREAIQEGRRLHGNPT